MPGRASQVDHLAAITKATDIAPHASALRSHVGQIVESPAFRGSRRSQEFLQYIVDRALEGRFDGLKERALGVEIFGRAPSYDTGDDSIVRVTARDVRKRLSQFYAESGADVNFRIQLSPGSYIPEFRSIAAPFVSDPRDEIDANEKLDISGAQVIPAISPIPDTACTEVSKTRFSKKSILLGTLLLLSGLAGVTVQQFWTRRGNAFAGRADTPPWFALVQSNRRVQVIFCDPDLVNLQRLSDSSISLSDYANQHYVPSSGLANLDAQRATQAASFRGANVASVDVGILLRIAKISGLGKSFSIDTHTARSIRLEDFKRDDSFVLLGSPRSNPWVELFQDQLDFVFQFNRVEKSEFIRNKHPHKDEVSAYVPTTEGWGTGQAYAIIGLVSNPNQAGQVLILAGSTAEATEAAGNLATNPELFSRTLKSYGIDPHDANHHFELLLRVSTMAGSPNTFEVIACHVLQGKVT